MIDRSQQAAARTFAITNLLMLVVIMYAFSHFYGPFLVWEHDAETARNFAAHPSLLRAYFAAAIAYGLGGIVVLTALSILFRPVGRGLALFAACARGVYVTTWFLGLTDLLNALRIMKGGGYLQAFEADRLEALAGLQLASGWDAYYIGLTFYALGSVCFSYLFLRSRYVPRVLAASGILCAVFEGVCGFAYLINRSFGAIVSPNWYEIPPMLFEVILSLWILFRGLRLSASAKAAAAN